MSELGYGQALILGVLQGITEFLPVSSSGHLALAQRIMHLDTAAGSLLLFNIMAHFGTLGAVLIAFLDPLRAFLRRLNRERRGGAEPRQFAWRLIVHMLIASAVTAAVGLPFQSTFEALFSKPLIIGAALMLTGLLLIGARLVPRGRRGWRAMRWHHAILIGLAQACAILPGLSRSGTTICMATFCGLRRRWTAEFSFLIAVPAILGATAKKLIDTARLPAETIEDIAFGPILLGSLIAFATGILALHCLIRSVRSGRIHYFAGYCILAGALVLALL